MSRKTSKNKKRKKRNLPDQVAKKKTGFSLKKENPFEYKINREKHPVLGRKIRKNMTGKPGVSRSKALTKRKETLLREYLQRNKSNKFVDRRLGEYDATMSLEDKMMARFTAERKTHHEKVDRFNLNDGEELTHFGQSLSEIEKFDDPRSDDDDDDNLGANFVKTMHFGGFLSKKDVSTGDGDESEVVKSRKETIEDMIKASKQRKHQRQSDKEETEEMTEKIDNEWKEVQSLVSACKSSSVAKDERKELEDFDVVVRELKFEMRAKPTDRLKTTEEIAREEKETLERLETDRLRRMEGRSNNDTSSNSARIRSHKSTDDLEDGLVYKPDDRYELQYKDGVAIGCAANQTLYGGQQKKKRVSFEDQKTSSSGIEESSDDSEDEAKLDDEKNDSSDSDDEESDEDDSYSDIDSEESDSEPEVQSSDVGAVEESGASEIKADLRKRKIIMDAARKELPYTFAAPGCYEEFLKLVADHSVPDQLTIVERLIKCHHPCLDPSNITKLEMLFSFLLQWISDVTVLENPAVDVFDGVVPLMYDIARLAPKYVACSVASVVFEKQNDFQKSCDRQSSGRTDFPELDTVMFLKLVSLLFPTSDYSHDVVTPSLVFMGQLLTHCKVTSGRDVIVGLFLCHLFLQCVSSSKRFVPEAINFLNGCFLSALDKNDNRCDGRPFVHPFKPFGPSAHLLLVQDKLINFNFKPVLVQHMQCDLTLTDEIRVSALHICINLLHRFAELYTNLPSFPIIFNPFLEHHALLPLDKLPFETQACVNELVNFLKVKISSFEISWLVHEKKKPQLFEFLEPRIEERFDGKQHRKVNSVTSDKQRLMHKYKREMKGAIREIRRDNQFLSKQQFAEQQERDAERKRKLKKLYHDLATQEGFCKEIERKKLKK